MTQLDAASILKNFRQQARQQVNPLAIGPVTSKVENESWWEDALYYLGKPEEWLAKGIGKLYSEDPKYYEDSSNLYNQVSFFDTAKDITGSDSLLANASLGLAMAVLNPTDPLNLLSFGKATKLGKVGELARAAKPIGKRGIYQIPIEELAEEFAAKVSKIDNPTKVAKLEKQFARTTQDLGEVNRYLEDLQLKQGMSFDEIVNNKGTFFDQVQRGQKSIIGFDPWQNPIIRKLGGKKVNTFNSSHAYKIPGADKVMAPLLMPMSTMMGALKSGAIKGLNVAGANIPVTEAEKRVAQIIHKLEQAKAIGKEVSALETLKTYNWYGAGIDKETLLQVIDNLETRTGNVTTRELREVIEGNSEDILGRKITEIGPDIEPRQLGVPGRDRSLQQQRLFNPAEPTRFFKDIREVQEVADEAAHVMKTGAYVETEVATRHDALYITPEHIVIRVPSGQDASRKNLRQRVNRLAKTNIPGLMPFATVENSNGFFLVTKNGNVDLDLIKKTFGDGFNSAQIQSVDREFSLLHLNNLEKMLAIAAQKGWAVTDLSPNKLLLGKNGEVQFIDPTIFRKAKRSGGLNQVDVAAQTSRDSMLELLGKTGLTQDHDFQILGHKGAYDRKKVRAVTPDDLVIQDLTPSARKLVGDDNIRFYSIEDLLKSQNAGLAKSIDDDQIRADYGIDSIAQKMLESNHMEPIRIVVDDKGNIFIKEGIERLAAARAAGIYESVPVIRDDFIGEVSKDALAEGAERTTHQSVGYLDNVFDAQPDTYSGMAPELREQLDDARIIENGSPIAIAQEGGTFDVLDSEAPIKSLGQFLSRRGSKMSRNLGWQYLRKVEGAVDDVLQISDDINSQRRAFFEVYDIVVGSKTPDDLYRRFEDYYGAGIINPKDKTRWIDRDEFIQQRMQLAELKAKFQSIKADLDYRGVFRAGDFDGMGKHAFDRNRIVVRKINGDVEYIAPWMPVEDLEQFVKFHVNSNMNRLPGDTKIRVLGDTNRSFTAEDLLNIARPKLQSLSPNKMEFFATEKTITELAERGIYVNPTPAVLREHGVVDAKGRLSSAPTGSFAFSLSGSLIFAPNINSVEEMLGAVFGEAPRYIQEFGVFDKGTIHIGNLFGFNTLSKIDAESIAEVEARMRSIAKRLSNAGFDENVYAEFHTRYGDVWNTLYPEQRKLRDLANGKVKLEIPEQLEGVSLAKYDERVPTNIKPRSELMPDGRSRELFKWVEENLDKTALDELEAGLPLVARNNYFPRFLSPELTKTLDEVGFRFFDKGHNQKYFDYWIKNFKGRKLSDLGFREVQKLFKDLQIDSSDLLAFDKLHGSTFMRQLAEIDPEAAQFFISDPILAVGMRMQQSEQALATKQAWDAMTKPIAEGGLSVWSGTIQEWRRAKGALSEDDALIEFTRQTRTRLLEARSKLDELVAADADESQLRRAQRLQERAEQTHQRALDRVSDAMIARSKANPLLSDISADFNLVAVDTRWAQQQVQAGILNEADILGMDWGAPFVRIQVDRMLEKNLDGVRMHVFTKETMDFMRKHYDVMYNKLGSFEKLVGFFDKLNNLFKQMTLFFGPSVIPYNIRNFFSNGYLGWLSGIDIDAYKDSLEALSLIRKYNRGGFTVEEGAALLEGRIYTNAAGQTVDLKELYGAFIRQGGLSGGLHVNEFGVSNEVLRKSVELGFSPASDLVSSSFIADNKLLKGGRDISAAMENHFRFAAFFDSWRKGSSFEEAGLAVKKAFYNYDELNLFEKNFLKRVFPFYSWMRFNTPRMLETLVTKPIIHYRMQKMVADIEKGAGGPPSDAELPSWLAKRWNMVVGREGGKLQIMGLDYLLPVGDLRKIFTTPGQFALDSLTPILKYPVSQLTNRSLYTFKEVETVPGQPARSGTLRSLGFSRRATAEGELGPLNFLLNESLVGNVRAAKWIIDWMDWAWDNTNMREEQPKFFARLLDALWSRTYDIDPYQVMAYKELERDKWVNRYQYEAKKAAARGDIELSDYYRSRLTEAATWE